MVQYSSEYPGHAVRIRFRDYGRARFGVDSLYRRPDRIARLERELVKQGGIRNIRANELTATLLVHFEETQVACEKIQALIEAFCRQGIDEDPSPKEETQWSRQTAQKVLERWGVRLNQGLSGSQVPQSLARFGPNEVPPPESPSDWELVSEQLKNLPTLLLGISAGLSLITGGATDAAVIGAVVATNAFLGFVNEKNAKRVIRSLSTTEIGHAEVLRDGKHVRIAAVDVVPGDLLILTPGKQVAADARIVKCDDLTTDESMLTGESQPVKKTVSLAKAEAFPSNLVFRGTTILGGSGLAVVTSTGTRTEMGQIHTLANQSFAPTTPLQKQLDQLGRKLALGIFGICGGMFLIGVIRRYGWLSMFKSSISLAVAAIPEGLPTVATTTFALASTKLRKQNLLARRMEAVETLGSVQVLCLDKTGTLTQNRMTVTRLFVGGRRLTPVEGGFVEANGARQTAEQNSELLRLELISVLCSEAEISREDEYFVLSGSSTEQALLQSALDCGIEADRVRQWYPRLAMLHRTEHRPYLVTFHETPDGSPLAAVKGRPAEVLARCSLCQMNGKLRPLSDSERRAIERENEAMAQDGLRVLGFAFGTNDKRDQKDLVWLGLVGMADPPRAGVKETLEALQGAGVHTLMLTGDQQTTAHAIGSALGLNGKNEMAVLDGKSIDDLSPLELAKACEKTHIVSRVTPRQKLKIIQALQRAGKVVAMSGDGVNDGPALRASDVGIAMGENGTEVAREVGDLVLKDDDLSTLLDAFREGRATHDNIKRSVEYVLATNLSEVAVVAGSILTGVGQPLGPLQLLWLNLVTDIFPAMALCAEPPDENILHRPPREPGEALLDRREVEQIGKDASHIALGALGCFAYGIFRYGRGNQASTTVFAHLTAAQLLHANYYRSRAREGRRNPYLTGAVGLGFALHGLSLFSPGLRALLGNARLSWMDLAVAEGTALLSHWLHARRGRPEEFSHQPADANTRRFSNGVPKKQLARGHSHRRRRRLRGSGSSPVPQSRRTARI